MPSRNNPYFAVIETTKNLATFNIQKGTKIIAKYAFSVPALESITIPNTITHIGSCAFVIRYEYYTTSNLKSVIFEENSQLERIGSSAFSGCHLLTSIELPASLLCIELGAFSCCDSLTNVIFEENSRLETLGKTLGVFGHCVSLKEIKIPASVKFLSSGEFEGCVALESIEVDENNINYKSIDGNLYSKDGTILIRYAPGKQDSEYTSLASVKQIDLRAFVDSSYLRSINISENIQSVGNITLENCTSLQNINVDERNQNYKSIDGNLYSKDGKTLIAYAIGKTATSFVVPSGVTNIGGYYACYGCKSLMSVTIPNSVTSIGEYAFSGCSSLTSITFNGTVAEWNDND